MRLEAMPAMSFLRSFFNCVSDRGLTDNSNNGATANLYGSSNGRITKIKFGVSLNEAFKSDQLPSPLRDLLVYIAREGVSVTDLFRRPGNPTDMKRIVKRLSEGRVVVWSEFNFYTLANVAKRFLLQIPGGVFGAESEQDLLAAMELPNLQRRFEAMHIVLARCHPTVRQLLALFFGIWFRMTYHDDGNAMSVEAVAKSVAGSLFHTCNDHPGKVEKASKAMEVLISGFSSTELFGLESINYFTTTTATSIRCLTDMFSINTMAPVSDFEAVEASTEATCVVREFKVPNLDNNLLNEEGLVNAEVHNIVQHDHQSTSSANTPRSQPQYSRRLSSVKQRQLDRLCKRSDWFLNSSTVDATNSTICLNVPLALATSGPDLLESGAVNLSRGGADEHDAEFFDGGFNRRRTLSASAIDDIVAVDGDDDEDEDDDVALSSENFCYNITEEVDVTKANAAASLLVN